MIVKHLKDAEIEVWIGFLNLKDRFVFEVVHVGRSIEVEVVRTAVTTVDITADEWRATVVRYRNRYFVWVG